MAAIIGISLTENSFQLNKLPGNLDKVPTTLVRSLSFSTILHSILSFLLVYFCLHHLPSLFSQSLSVTSPSLSFHSVSFCLYHLPSLFTQSLSVYITFPLFSLSLFLFISHSLSFLSVSFCLYHLPSLFSQSLSVYITYPLFSLSLFLYKTPPLSFLSVSFCIKHLPSIPASFSLYLSQFDIYVV